MKETEDVINSIEECSSYENYIFGGNYSKEETNKRKYDVANYIANRMTRSKIAKHLHYEPKKNGPSGCRDLCKCRCYWGLAYLKTFGYEIQKYVEYRSEYKGEN